MSAPGADRDRETARGEDSAEVTSTVEIPLPPRVRRLRGVVLGTLSFCGLILVAAGISRLSRGCQPSPESTLAARPAASVPASSAVSAPPPAASPSSTAPATATPSANPPQSTGTIRLERYMTPRWVWLDGKRFASRTERVACGTHQIKVGYGATRSIEIPCGGEITLEH